MIICDTGALPAVANDKDAAHVACTALFEAEPGPLVVPATIVTEVCYMLGRLGPDKEGGVPARPRTR